MISPLNLHEEFNEQLTRLGAVYCVFRCVGEIVREAYACDTHEETEQLKERMEGFAGEFHVLAKPN